MSHLFDWDTSNQHIAGFKKDNRSEHPRQTASRFRQAFGNLRSKYAAQRADGVEHGHARRADEAQHDQKAATYAEEA